MGRFPASIKNGFLRALARLFLLAALLSLAGASPASLAAPAAQKPGAQGLPRRVAKARRPSRPLTLDQRIEAVLRRAEARRGFWGIEVVRLSDGKTLYTRNADHLFLPASNMKLFTTAAALEKLGPDFVFRTTVESETRPDAQGRVGDLYLVGRGDPNLSGRVLPYQMPEKWEEAADRFFEKLADQVAARGVREVEGNLVADDSYFLYEPYSHNWAQEDVQWGYGAPVTALAFNDNALFIRVKPGAGVGERGQVELAPVPDYYRLNNHVETGPPRSKKQLFVERQEGSVELDVWGEMPLGSAEDEDTVAIVNPPQLIGELFRRALEARGVKVRGWVEVHHLARIEAAALQDPFPKPPRRVVLAQHVSLPLREDIKVINKVSQNLHAEMLLRTLGHELRKYGSLTVGLEVLEVFARRVGVDKGETHFADGSGLSREALVSPHAVVKLLKYMAGSPHFDVFYDSMPVAGVDGTLNKRFKDSPAEGRIHAKTGTIAHVNSLSGYMDLPSGQKLAFSIIGNSHPMKPNEGASALDRIALAIYDRFAAEAPAPPSIGKLEEKAPGTPPK